MFSFKPFYSFTLKFLEGIVSVLLTLTVIIPVVSLLWIVNTTVRLLVSLNLRLQYAGTVKLTSNGLDNIWGYRTPGGGNSRNVLFTAVYSERVDGLRYRTKFESDVINFKAPDGSQPYKKLQKILVQLNGYYCWKLDPNFDIKNHIIVYPDDKIWKESELLELLRELSEDMGEDHPQWQEIIIPRFTYNLSKSKMAETESKNGEQSLRILRFHHSYGDAGSWLLLYSYCMADGKIPYAVNPLKGFPIPAWKVVIYYCNAVIFGTTTMLKALWYGTNVRSNRLVTTNYNGDKFFSWTDIVDLTIVKAIKNKTKVAIPTIISSVIASSLRKFDEEYPLKNKAQNSYSRSKIHEYTDIGAVAAILPYPSLKLMNRFTIANFTVPTGDMNRIERLNRTHKLFLKITQSPEPLLNYWMFSFFGLFPAKIINVLMRSAGTPLIFSNLPGASAMFQLMGDSVADGGAWVPLLTVAGLSISAAGYREKVRFCGSTDSACMSKEELKYILQTIVEEIKLLYEDTVGIC